MLPSVGSGRGLTLMPGSHLGRPGRRCSGRLAPSSSRSAQEDKLMLLMGCGLGGHESTSQGVHPTSPSMLRATLMVPSRVPKEGGTSGSKAGALKLRTNSVRYSARSIH